ncbi:MAG: oligosaccharide flippase family protein [bacterium]
MLGKATILLLISQFALLVSGYTINVGLARFFGPGDYGTFTVVMSFLLVVQLFVITGIPIALQKYIAENLDASKLLFRKTVPWHVLYSLGVWLLFWLASPVIASWFSDPALSLYLRIASVDILFYGLYKYYLSLHNGLHEFGRQTVMGVAYSVAKVTTIFALVFLGFGLKGAIIGNTLGSVGGLIVGMFLVRFPEVTEKLGEVPFFKFAFTNVFYYVGLQLIFSIDIWSVKYYLNAEMVGQYSSAASMAKIPYFLSLAVSSAILPTISLASKLNNMQRVRDIVRITLRYWLILLFAMIVVVSSIAPSLILLFFGEQYRSAGPILAVLFTAIALVTFFAVMNTVLIARNKLKPCLAVTGVLILAHIIANVVLVPRFHGMGAALATLIVALLGNLLSTLLLLHDLKVVMPVFSAIRTVTTGVVVILAVYTLPIFDQPFVTKSLMVLSLFLSCLFLLRELNIADVKRFQAVLTLKT